MVNTGDISVVMITVNRSPRENYLGQTIDNLERGGVFTSNRLHSFTLRVGAPLNRTTAPDYRTQVFRVEKSNANADIRLVTHELLPCENVGQALLTGSRLAPPDGWVLFLEDDIDVCTDFLGSVGKWLDKFERADAILYQFGCSYVEPSSSTRWWEYPSARDFYGTQAIAMRPWAAQALGPILLSHEDSYLSRFKPSEYDLMIGHHAANCEYKIAASVPSFIQHIGTQSSLSDRLTCHTFPSWPGREWSYV